MSDEEMNLSVNVNGHSKVPPGFRFHPTEEELLHYYLKKKVACEKIDLDVIRDVDLNKLEPWDIQEKCRIGSTPQNDWYFFSHKDKKYPTGTRTNRATAAGFWKATGRDKVIYSSFRRIGMRKTLVFYKGRAPHGQKSDWIMHEYRLDDISNTTTTTQDVSASNLCDATQEDGWVVCRVFKKKNYHKALESPQRSLAASMDSRAQLQSLNKDGVLDQLLVYMGGRSCKQETESIGNLATASTSQQNTIQQFINPINDRFFNLPRLDTISPHDSSPCGFDHQGTSFKSNNHNSICDILAEDGHEQQQQQQHHPANGSNNNMVDTDAIRPRLDNWGDVDRLVASQLNGQMDSSSNHLYSCYGGDLPSEDLCFSFDQDDQEPPPIRCTSSSTAIRPNQAAYASDIDLWTFARSSSSSSSPDPLCHLSV